MRFRWHRGGLGESMETAFEFDGLEDLIAKMNDDSPLMEITSDAVTVQHYGYDPRVLWDTYIILLDGHPLGFTDGKPT